MKITMTLAMTGMAGRHVVYADEAIEQIADRLLSTPGAKVRVRDDQGNLHEAEIVTDTVTVRILGDGRQALQADIEIADGILDPPAQPAILSGADATEADRAATMAELEPPA